MVRFKDSYNLTLYKRAKLGLLQTKIPTIQINSFYKLPLQTKILDDTGKFKNW